MWSRALYKISSSHFTSSRFTKSHHLIFCSFLCCGLQTRYIAQYYVMYGWQILRAIWPYLDSVTIICWIITNDILYPVIVKSKKKSPSPVITPPPPPPSTFFSLALTFALRLYGNACYIGNGEVGVTLAVPSAPYYVWNYTYWQVLFWHVLLTCTFLSRTVRFFLCTGSKTFCQLIGWKRHNWHCCTELASSLLTYASKTYFFRCGKLFLLVAFVQFSQRLLPRN